MRALTPRAIRLAERMDLARKTILANLPESDLAPLRAEIRSLKAMLGGTGAAAGAPPDRVRAEVARFRETGRLPDVRAARLVCWGTTVEERDAPALIEDGDRFAPLLDEVDGYRAMPRPYRRCWRGLLDGYVRYDPDRGAGPGKRNWTLLRDYLNDNLPGLERAGQPPDWMRAIDEHSNLLTEDPCGRYGAELLESGSDVLEPLRRELSAGDSSWIGQRIFDAQIDAAIGFDDRRLRRVIPRVLALIGEHPVLADGALARILDRYAVSSPPEIEPALRDASVARWGNPWLERNDSKWKSVQPATQQMVSSWLKLRLIEDFFGLLSEDRANDQRRIAFWKRYVEQITDMHFALGDAAYHDRRPDFVALRQAMKGRLLQLDSGGTGRNNAFIMKIGGHVFVEFGEKGNAMFAFDAERLPFDLRKSYVAGNRTALKHPSHAARIVHIDSSGERWERKIERCIQKLSGSRAPAEAASRPATAVPPVFRPAFLASGTGDVLKFLAENRIRSLDSRDKGGSLWAYAPERGPASAELRRRGFFWSPRRSAWFLKS